MRRIGSAEQVLHEQLARIEERPDIVVQPPGRVGRATMGVYCVVDEVDAHCERARAAGAEITREPEDTPYGSREYTARDLEGHPWSFGTYAPGSEE